MIPSKPPVVPVNMAERLGERRLCHRYGIWYIDMVIYHIDNVILDIDMGYDLMIWERTASIWSFSISVWDIL
jgi:hypothetical protein